MAEHTCHNMNPPFPYECTACVEDRIDAALERGAEHFPGAAPTPRDERQALRAVFTNEVIRAIGALARQQNVCREQGGKMVFVTGMEAAREYIIEQIIAAQEQTT